MSIFHTSHGLTVKVSLFRGPGDGAQHRGSVRTSHPAGPGSILGVSKIFFEFEFLDVVEIYQQQCTA